jgi:hypothetical protein
MAHPYGEHLIQEFAAASTPLVTSAHSMRLGAMLVRDGRLTPAQVLAAVAQQARVGGRIGTVLVEMRLIDVDTLTVYLGIEMGIPIATRAALDRAKRTALRVLSAEQAERYHTIPLLIQDHQLIAAMRDPLDLPLLDELAHLTGYRLIPRVAPEVRLWWYLERYYGVSRPPRFQALGDSVVQPRPQGSDVPEPPPPPLPGLPPPVPAVATAARVAVTLGNPAGRLVGLPERDLGGVTALHHDELAAHLEGAPDVAHPPPPRDARTVDVEAMARAAVSPIPGMSQPTPISLAPPDSLSLDAALLRMAVATSRSEIADALLGHARSLLDAGVLLIVRDELAFGWKGFGPDVVPDRVETLLVPLESSSLFRAAIDAADVFATSPPATSLQLHLLKVLRAPMPARAVVAPVSINQRAVNLLYGQVHGERTLPESSIDELRAAAQAAAKAYVRLIALHKSSSS